MDEIVLLPDIITIFSILLMDYHPSKKKISLIQIQSKSLPLNLTIHSLSHQSVKCSIWKELLFIISCVYWLCYFHKIFFHGKRSLEKFIGKTHSICLQFPFGYSALCIDILESHFRNQGIEALGNNLDVFSTLNTSQHPGGRFSTPAIQRSSSSVGGNPFA